MTVWNPATQELTLENLLDNAEISSIVGFALTQGITPFVNAIGDQHNHFIFHGETLHEVEKELVKKFFSHPHTQLLPLASLSDDSQVTNISMIGEADKINEMWLHLNTYANLIAYSGPAMEGNQYRWMDVHHCQANKGSAVSNLKSQLGAKNVICFGDSDNDLSMFVLADECYAPENAKAEIKTLASAVIGHNHQDGIAHFLRERFSL